MIRRASAIVLILAMIMPLAGCWSRKELNQLAIAVGAGIDKKGDHYRLSIQVVDPGEVASKNGGANRAAATLFTAEAETVFEAARKMSRVAPRKIYFSHLRMFVIDEILAKEGIGPVLDFLSRDHEFRTDFYIVVTRDSTAEDVLKIMTPLEDIPANKLYFSLESSEKNWSPSLTVTLDELIQDMTLKGKQPVLTGLKITGDKKVGKTKRNIENIETYSKLQYSGLAVFKADKLIGWLNDTQSKGYNYIRGLVQSSVGHVPCENGGGNVVTEIIRTKTDMKGLIQKGQPLIKISVYIEGNVAEVSCSDLDLNKESSIFEIEKRDEESIKGFMLSAIKKTQEDFKVDTFGFGEAIRRTHPAFWKTIKEDWEERYFPELPVHITVDFKIRRLGTVNNSFLKDMEE
ncbi:Ger(x)C family spore germination protein [Paenibacillus oenotherae]|uniref:Ger(X)C family spore germination protein n=2 Tax=Paenibacillus oenotherae TaxID=1435645 RepID=A0ABS7D329_9BACL|nr:Ger(x)C family spore germination protein [Paenibacillus oenotherae]MBW7474253.1 Ger(x)C family spore germination protein [Paenibacillus oenotherae]